MHNNDWDLKPKRVLNHAYMDIASIIPINQCRMRQRKSINYWLVKAIRMIKQIIQVLDSDWLEANAKHSTNAANL